MPSHRAIAFSVAAVAAATLIGTLIYGTAQGQKMLEIKFDLGKNIVDTARASGVPRFSADDIAGLVSYSINGIAEGIPASYTRPGYEIRWQPLFAFTMYSNRNRNSALPVERVHLQLKNSPSLRTHEGCQAFVEQTIAQFAKGNWQRYYDPEWNTLLTGRSSFLDESGQIGGSLMTVDPAYKLSLADWILVADNGASWRWVGDGVLATLHVFNMPREPNGPLTCNIDLDFELLDSKLKRDTENLARELKEGDAKGWGSTARQEADKIEVKARNKLLEQNAIKRGDSVVTPQP